MASNITHYFSKKLNQVFENNIKYSLIFEYEIIIITNEDKVYVFDRNAINNTSLIFSSDESIIEQKINESLVEELSNKGIIDLKISKYYRIARTYDGDLYCWGNDTSNTLLDRSNRTDINIYKPVLSDEFMSKKIIEMAFNERNAVILTNDGNVYYLMDRFLSITTKEDRDQCPTEPCDMTTYFEEKATSIACGFRHSLVLTASGRVYSWGDNDCSQLGRDTVDERSLIPALIELTEDIIIEKISCGHKHSLLLSREGDIYVFGSNYERELGNSTSDARQLSPIKLDTSLRFTEILSLSVWECRVSAALSTNGLIYVWGDCDVELKETQSTSFSDIFFNYFDKTFKPIEGKLYEFNDDFIRKDLYKRLYNEKESLGIGSYGEVFHVELKSAYSGRLNTAIKRIELKFDEQKKEYFNETVLKELQHFSVIKQLIHENIIEHYNLWFEIKDPFHIYAYIHMELCDKSLFEIMEYTKTDTKLYKTLLGYYVLIQLYTQILEGVNFLHARFPSIIHGDLTPFNILIKIHEEKNSVVKISDFGYAFLYKYADQNHTEDKGYSIYISPEVQEGSNYDTTADIYSLGVVLQKLLHIDFNRDYAESNEGSPLLIKYQELRELSSKMSQRSSEDRPQTCREILDRKQFWELNETEINVKYEFEDLCDNCNKEFKESYIFKLIEHLS